MEGRRKGREPVVGGGPRRWPQPDTCSTAATTRRYTARRKRELVEGFEGSGLTQKKYFARHEITPTSLLAWRKAPQSDGPEALGGQRWAGWITDDPHHVGATPPPQ